MSERYWTCGHAPTDGENDNPIRCQWCNDVIDDRNDVYETPDGEQVCYECFSEECFVCDACDEVFWLDDAHFAVDEVLCEDCFYEYFVYCEGCGEPVDSDDAWFSEIYDAYYCEECFYERCAYCIECDVEVDVEEARDNGWIGKDGSYFCEGCWEEFHGKRELTLSDFDAT